MNSLAQQVWLLVDTACPHAVVGVARGDRVLAEVSLTETMRHAETLCGAVEQCLTTSNLTMDDVSGVAVGEGPGSFIGVRIGIAYAKGVAVARQIPLVGVSTLKALANACDVPEGIGFSVIDARRQQVFLAKYRRQNIEGQIVVETLVEPKAVDIPEAEQRVTGADFVVGFGIEPCVTHPTRGATAIRLLRTLQQKIVQQGDVIDECARLVPNYCREPDAKPNVI